jgi:hypothetical protein
MSRETFVLLAVMDQLKKIVHHTACHKAPRFQRNGSLTECCIASRKSYEVR